MRLFQLLFIVIIAFGFLVLRLTLGIGGDKSLFLMVEVPNMITSLFSSAIILSVEFIIWYIFRVREKQIRKIIIKRNKQSILEYEIMIVQRFNAIKEKTAKVLILQGLCAFQTKNTEVQMNKSRVFCIFPVKWKIENLFFSTSLIFDS